MLTVNGLNLTLGMSARAAPPLDRLKMQRASERQWDARQAPTGEID
jgi:hypothetical protein